MASGPITWDHLFAWQIEGEKLEAVTDFIFLGSKSLWTVTTATKLKDSCSWKESYDKPRQSIKKQRHHLANKLVYSQLWFFQ